jgi:type VI secretion system secreted protein VgrG
MPWYEPSRLIERPITVLDKAWNFLYPQHKRFLQLTSPHTYGPDFHNLLIMQMTGHEGLCEGFCYRVQVITYLGAVDLKEWIGKNIGISMSHDHEGERHVCGFIRSVKQLSDDHGTVLYELEVVDALTMLKQRTTWRVFQLMDVVQITEKILFEHGETNPGLRSAFENNTQKLRNDYPKRGFTLQAGESDHDFLTRLWRQEGICWHFTHDLVGNPKFPQHTLHLTDSPDSFETCAAAEIRYHRDASVSGRDTITHWHGWRAQSVKKVHRHQTEYQNHSVLSDQSDSPLERGPECSFWGNWNLLDSQLDPAHFTDSREHQQQRTMNIALAHQYRAKGFEGLSYVRAMQAGTLFKLEWNQNISHPTQHINPDDKQFLITRVHLYARNNLGIDQDQLPKQFQTWAAHSDGNTPVPSEPPMYINRFECVRKNIPVVPHYDPAIVPKVGPLSATVWTREDDEEIRIDPLGRVLVRFPFTLDVEHQNQFYNPHFAAPDPDEADRTSHSAFVRVMQPWANKAYGTSFFPRKGEEVVVMFMNNHPDKPFIAGSLYNGKEEPIRFHSSSQVHQHMLSGIRSKEYQDWRHNHLLFDDTNKQISTQLHSDHAYSQLTHGYLTTPRGQGAKPRGEGFELRTDESGAIRTAKGLLISSYERLKAESGQLSRDETQALMEQSLALFQALNKVASQAQGLPSDTAPHGELSTQLKNWENGSNTAPNTTGGGAPIITLSAPAGLIQNTPETIATQAGKNIDSIALQHHQFTSGKNTILNAGHGISAFAHTQDLKTIAHQGQWIAQAQHNDALLDAGKNINIRAHGGKVVIQASDEVILQAGDGTFVKLGGGKLTLGTSGSATIHAASHSMTGPKTLSVPKTEEIKGCQVKLSGSSLDGGAGVPR